MSSCPTSTPGAKKRWRIIELIKWGERYFSSKGFNNPRREIEWLLTDLLSLSRVDLYLEFDSPVSRDQLRMLKSWIKRRLAGEPLQYITGCTQFYSLLIHVNPHVLIPRPETERVVEVALDLAKQTEAHDIVDVGTGSGCIAIALATNLDDVKILATDNSESALQLAEQNAGLNKVTDKIRFAKTDILTEDLGRSFDLLVSNPPYLQKDEMATLMPEIRDFEPIDALTDGGDGLEFYRRFVNIARKCVREGGFLVLELGLGSHPKRVRNLFEKSRFELIQLHQDYNGDDRVITIGV